jgi:hypothetical protein
LHYNNLLIDQTGKIIVIDFGSSSSFNEAASDVNHRQFSDLISKYTIMGQIKVADVIEIISILAHIELSLIKQKGLNNYSPLSDYLDDVRQISGFDVGHHPIFENILQKYYSLITPLPLNDELCVIPHSVDGPQKKRLVDEIIGGKQRTRRRPTHTKRRRKRTRRKRTLEVIYIYICVCVCVYL